MTPNRTTDEFRLHLKVLSGVLAFFILLFYLFPDVPRRERRVDLKLEVKIQIEQIPRTGRKPTGSARRPGYFSEHLIPMEMEEEDLPEDLPLDTLGQALSETLPDGMVDRRAPRPIIDVYPRVFGVACKGEVKLLLEIAPNGTVVQVQILENALNNSRCLEAAVKAAYDTRWETNPASRWVVKVYRFEND